MSKDPDHIFSAESVPAVITRSAGMDPVAFSEMGNCSEEIMQALCSGQFPVTHDRLIALLWHKTKEVVCSKNTDKRRIERLNRDLSHVRQLIDITSRILERKQVRSLELQVAYLEEILKQHEEAVKDGGEQDRQPD